MVDREINRRSVLKALSGASAGITGLSSMGAVSATQGDSKDPICPPGGCGGSCRDVVRTQCIYYYPSQPKVVIDQGCAGNAYSHGDAYAECIHSSAPNLADCRTMNSLSREIAIHRGDNDDRISLACNPELSSSPSQE